MRLIVGLIAVSISGAAHAQAWTNPAVDQNSLKPLTLPGPQTFPTLPPPPATRAKMTAGGITDGDYPQAAMNSGEGGTVTARIVIDAKGNVINCATLTEASLPSLSATTCAILQQRFKFSPALDAKGKPISETRIQRITWRLPFQTVPAYPVQLLATQGGIRVPLQLIVDAKGRLGQCRIANTDHAAIAYQADICGTLARNMVFPVKNAANGKPGAYVMDHVVWIAQTVPGEQEQNDR